MRSVPRSKSGPQIGFWQNFVSLIRSDDIDSDLFAYSDQDDVWFPEKLARAESWFEARPTDQPVILYFTRTELIEAASGRMVMWNDVNLNVLGITRNLLTPHNEPGSVRLHGRCGCGCSGSPVSIGKALSTISGFSSGRCSAGYNACRS